MKNDYAYQDQRKGYKEKSRSFQEERDSKRPPAFSMQYEPADNMNTNMSLKNTHDVKTKTHPGEHNILCAKDYYNILCVEKNYFL